MTRIHATYRNHSAEKDFSSPKSQRWKTLQGCDEGECFRLVRCTHGTIRVLCHRKLRQCYRIISLTIRLLIILFTRSGKHVIRVLYVINIMLVKIYYRYYFFRRKYLSPTNCSINFMLRKIVHTWMDRRER